MKRASNWFSYAFLTLAGVLFIYPVMFLFVSSFKSYQDIYTKTWSFFTKFSLDNFYRAWDMANLSRAYKNSLTITGIATGIILICSILAAFSFANWIFKGKRTLYFVILASLMIPLETLVVPLFISLKNYGLLNNLFGVILPYAAIGIPFSTLVLTEFFKEIPVELRDAARIDGCSDFRYLWQIVIPLSGPAISGVTIFQGSIIWNEFIIALTILQASALYTIPLEVATFSRRYYTEWPLVFSTLSISMIPVMLLYAVFQRSYVKGMTLGAIKG